MPVYTQEEHIILAIKAIRTSQKKLSQQHTAKIYNILQSTLSDRFNNRPQRQQTRVQDYKLDPVEEQTLVQYIIDQDVRGMPIQLSGVKDMADLLLVLHSSKPVGKLWARRFVDTQPTLKTKFNCRYDYQRALCEDPEVISK